MREKGGRSVKEKAKQGAGCAGEGGGRVEMKGKAGNGVLQEGERK